MPETNGENKPSSSARTRSRAVAYAGVIAATYASFTLITIMFLGNFAWGPVQLRVSEALTVLPMLTASAIPGLAIGCVLANLGGAVLTGSGILGLLDAVFGTIATLLGALWTRRFRNRPAFALLGPVLANALIVPAYLPIIVKGFGFYTIPFTTIDVEANYLLAYIFGFVAIAIGEAIVVYGLGYPLLLALRRLNLFNK